MSENHRENPIEPETVGKITYWKRQLHLLKEPVVLLMIIGVAVFSWKLSGWHKEGVIEAKKAELTLLKAKLDVSVADANKAIGHMKKLGLVLSAPIVDELAVSGQMFKYIHLKYKLERVKNIADNLKKLGASQNEINDVCGTIYSRVTHDHLRRIIASLREPNPDKKDLLKNILEKKLDELDVPKILKFINDNNLKKSKETDNCFSDLEYFLKNKKLRREDKWQS